MPSHVHLIFRAKDHNTDVLLGRFKEHRSKQIVKALKKISRKAEENGCYGCLPAVGRFERAGLKSSNVKGSHFWQHNNKPIEL